MKIGITGSGGLLGWHLRCFLLGFEDIEVATATRETFQSPESLTRFVSGCDAIAHFAGMNRGDDRDVVVTNIDLTQKLLEACDSGHVTPHILFSSSTHIYRGTPYGESKKICMEKLHEWGEKRGSAITSLILPHVFGEGGKPFYNSVVSTFCHQLAENQEPQIHVDGQLDLLHAGDVATRVMSCVTERQSGSVECKGYSIQVSALLSRLRTMASEYAAQRVPDVREPIDLALFNTFRFYLYPKHYPVKLMLRSDSRGHLFEPLRSEQGGQVFVSTTKPGITRGNHFHRRKIERFCVISGMGIVRLRRLFDDSVVEFSVKGEEPQYIDIPTLHTHNITNSGQNELITLFWTNEIFNPDDRDTVPQAVSK